MGDDLLRLMFTACHPVLSIEARVALTLRLLGGLTTDEIARAFLVPEPTIAQRIVRAKRTLADEAAFPSKSRAETSSRARLSSVLEVIYLIFNEGYSATAGDDWMRPALCEDALRLGRILAELAPQEPEVHGLVALMEIQASRARARVGPSGEPILLFDQNRALWDQLLIRRGLAALERAERLGTARPARPRGGDRRVSCARRQRGRNGLAPHRRALHRVGTSGAIARRGAEPRGRGRHGLRSTGRPRARRSTSRDPSLTRYHLLPSVRGDLLEKLGRWTRRAPNSSARRRSPGTPASETCCGPARGHVFSVKSSPRSAYSVFRVFRGQ